MQELEQNGKKRRQIGVIITCGTKETWRNTFDAMCENYYHDIEVGLQKEMVKNHCAFIVERVDAMSANIRVPQILKEHLVDGVFIVGGVYRESLIRLVQRYELPTVLIGRDHPKLDYVTSDYKDCVYKGIKYLLERGHRDILFINGPANSATSLPKEQGLQKAFDEISKQVSEKWCVQSEFSGDVGYWATKMAYENRRLRPTAIFAGSDTIAAGVLGYLYEQRLRVPDDVSVLAYERGMLTEYLTPVLTSIDVHKKEIGKKAGKIMIQRIEHPELPQQMCVVPAELYEGASVRRLGSTDDSDEGKA